MDKMTCSICNNTLSGRYYVDAWDNKICESHFNKDAVHCTSCSAFTRSENVLTDGRVLCKTCFGSAIKKGDSFENLKKFVVSSLFNAGFNDLRMEDITFEIVTTQKMAEIRNEPVNVQFKGYTYSTVTTSTTAGILSGIKSSQTFIHKIYILTHLNKEEFAATLAHEILHAWLTQNGIKMSKKLEEGFCNIGCYVIYTYLPGAIAKMYLKSLHENPDPIYGDGFREMFGHFKRLGWQEQIKNVREKKYV